MKYTNKRNELMKRARAELGIEEDKYDWKDWLYIIPGVLLLVWIIIRAILTNFGV